MFTLILRNTFDFLFNIVNIMTIWVVKLQMKSMLAV